MQKVHKLRLQRVQLIKHKNNIHPRLHSAKTQHQTKKNKKKKMKRTEVCDKCGSVLEKKKRKGREIPEGRKCIAKTVSGADCKMPAAHGFTMCPSHLDVAHRKKIKEKRETRQLLKHSVAPDTIDDEEVVMEASPELVMEIVEEAPKAAVEAPKPAEALKPVEEAPKAAVEAPKPVEEVPKATEEAPKPVEEAPKTVTEAPEKKEEATA
jgi:hypothetical protein